MPRAASMAASPAVASSLLDERRRILNLCVKSCRTRRYGLCAHRICRCRRQRGSRQRSSKFLHADLRFRCKENVCAGKRAQPISRAKQEQHHRGAMSMLSLRPGNFALIVGIALCAAQRLSRPRASDPGKCSTCFEVICGQPEGHIASPAAADDLLSCRAWNQ